MNIIGVGTDIVQMDRIAKIYAKYGQQFLDKNFHILEIRKFEDIKPVDKIRYLAKRFAAKEAIAKALGTGIAGGLAFKDIAITNNENGAPVVVIDNKELTSYKINISIADDPPIAVAFAVISL